MSDYYGECRVNTWYWVYQCQQEWRPFNPFTDWDALADAMTREAAERIVGPLIESILREVD